MGTGKFCRTFYCFLQETRDQVPKQFALNDSKKNGIDCCYTCAGCHAHASGLEGRRYRSEALLQCNIAGLALDVGRRFVVAVSKITNYAR
jgi:hypothetical protein